jgi:hypothetical protein
MEWIEKDRAQLGDILKEMDIPEMRKDIKRLGNLRWLQRNLLIRNRNHPKATEALGIIKLLTKVKGL